MELGVENSGSCSVENVRILSKKLVKQEACEEGCEY